MLLPFKRYRFPKTLHTFIVDIQSIKRLDHNWIWDCDLIFVCYNPFLVAHFISISFLFLSIFKQQAKPKFNNRRMCPLSALHHLSIWLRARAVTLLVSRLPGWRFSEQKENEVSRAHNKMDNKICVSFNNQSNINNVTRVASASFPVHFFLILLYFCPRRG